MRYKFKQNELVLGFFRSSALHSIFELSRVNESKLYLYLERYGETTFNYDSNDSTIVFRKGVFASALIKVLA